MGWPNGVHLQSYNASGSALHSPVLVASYDGSLTELQDGSLLFNSDSGDVYARRFDTAGNELDSSVVVNQTTSGSQSSPQATVLPDGSYAIAWQGNGPGDNSGIFIRHFAADGTALSDDFLVNTTTDNTQNEVSVATFDDGDLLVQWTDSAADGSGDGIFARRISLTDITIFEGLANGAAVGRVSASDPEDTLVFSLQDDAGGALCH